MSRMVLRRLIRSPSSPPRGAWPVEETFKTGRDLSAWDQFRDRTFGAICRHATLTALGGATTCPPPPVPGLGPVDHHAAVGLQRSLTVKQHL